MDGGDGLWHFPSDADDLFFGIGIAIAVILFAVVAWFFLLPLLLVVFDVALIVVFVLLGLLSRVLLGRPWVVEAVCADGTDFTWEVTGVRKSMRVIAAVTRALENGSDVGRAAVSAGANAPRRNGRGESMRKS